MSLSKNDYELIAGLLRVEYGTLRDRWDVNDLSESEHAQRTIEVDTIARRLAALFETTNPRFDSQKFFVACGLTFDGLPPFEDHVAHSARFEEVADQLLTPWEA